MNIKQELKAIEKKIGEEFKIDRPKSIFGKENPLIEHAMILSLTHDITVGVASIEPEAINMPIPVEHIFSTEHRVKKARESFAKALKKLEELGV